MTKNLKNIKIFQNNIADTCFYNKLVMKIDGKLSYKICLALAV